MEDIIVSDIIDDKQNIKKEIADRFFFDVFHPFRRYLSLLT
jgi:hypothetical protein